MQTTSTGFAGAAPDRTSVGGSFGARLRRWAAEPLLHFTLLGALVFAGHRALTAHTKDARVLEVSVAKKRELAKLFEQRQHQPPSDAELSQLVSRYVEDEVLFREGLRLSLVQTDPMLRAQLIARVRGMLQAEVNAKPPSEEQLLEFYQEHHSDYASAEAVSYREYVVPLGPDASETARNLSLSLQRGDEPGPGAPPPIDHTQLSERQLGDVAGPELAPRIWTLPLGVWRELSSRSGVHVLRVDEHTTASEPPFTSVHDQVLAEYRKEQTARAFRAEVEGLTSQWRVHLAEEK